MKKITGVVRAIEIDDAGSFHVHLDCGPTYRRTVWTWIDGARGYYRVRQITTGHYKRSHKGYARSESIIGEPQATYDECIPIVAKALVDLLAQVDQYGNGMLRYLTIAEKHIEKS